MVSKEAVRRVGIERCQSRIEAEPCRAVGTEDRVRLAHIDVGVRVVLRRGHADALEFPHPDADFRDAAVVPELQIAAAGHRLRARKNRARCRPGDRYCSKVRRCSLAKATAKATNSRMLLARRPSSRPLEYGAVPWRSDRSSSMSLVRTSLTRSANSYSSAQPSEADIAAASYAQRPPVWAHFHAMGDPAVMVLARGIPRNKVAQQL